MPVLFRTASRSSSKASGTPTARPRRYAGQVPASERLYPQFAPAEGAIASR